MSQTVTGKPHVHHVEEPEHHRMSAKRIIIAIVLFVALLTAAWAIRMQTHDTTSAPAQSTDQTNPNVPENTPPSGSVNQGSDAGSATTPSPTGTSTDPNAENSR